MADFACKGRALTSTANVALKLGVLRHESAVIGNLYGTTAIGNAGMQRDVGE